MYYQNYEDYMRSVLGYPPAGSNTYYNDSQQDFMPQQVESMQEERQEWYPEIYKIVYPMVRKAVEDNGTNELTEDAVENMTNIIYTNIEVGDVEVSGNQSQTVGTELKNGDVVNPRAKVQQPQRETRQVRQNNPLLRDLIRILILREFFDRRRPNRPPFPGRPGQRPPFPGGPGMPPPPMSRYY